MTNQTQMVSADAIRAWRDKYKGCTGNNALEALDALLPSPPTLADMTAEERADCQWMQASFTKSHHKHIITQVFGEKARLLRRVDGAMFEVHHDEVIPYPDLPRFVWPGDTPALPDGWRLADHERYGRIIVTNTSPNIDGHVHFVMPADDPLGQDWMFCHPDELAYLSQ